MPKNIFNKAYRLLEAGKTRDAIKEFELCQARDLSSTEYLEGQVGLARAYYKNQEFTKSFDLAKKVIVNYSKKDLTVSQLNSLRLTISKYYQKEKQYLFALGELDLTPATYIPARIEELEIYRKCGQWQLVPKKISQIETLLKKEGNVSGEDFAFQKIKFLCLCGMDKRDEARILFKNLLEKSSNKVHYLLGAAYALPGTDLEMRHFIFDSLLEKYPNDYKVMQAKTRQIQHDNSNYDYRNYESGNDYSEKNDNYVREEKSSEPVENVSSQPVDKKQLHQNLMDAFKAQDDFLAKYPYHDSKDMELYFDLKTQFENNLHVLQLRFDAEINKLRDNFNRELSLFADRQKISKSSIASQTDPIQSSSASQSEVESGQAKSILKRQPSLSQTWANQFSSSSKPNENVSSPENTRKKTVRFTN